MPFLKSKTYRKGNWYRFSFKQPYEILKSVFQFGFSVVLYSWAEALSISALLPLQNKPTASTSWPHLTCTAFTSDRRRLSAHVLHIKINFCLYNPPAQNCMEKLDWLGQRGSLLKHCGHHRSRSEQNFKPRTSDLKEAAFTQTPYREESFSLLQMHAEVGHIYK